MWDSKLARLFVGLVPVALVAGGLSASPQNQDQPGSLVSLQQAFERPPEDSKIMMRWWWFGPSATTTEIERELALMKRAGIGGFEVQPVYPLALDNPNRGFHNYSFLSDPFIEALHFTSVKAQELGLRMDLTLGSGWPYGGPTVPIAQAAGKLRIERVPVMPGTVRVPLPYITTREKFLAVFVAKGGDVKNFEAEEAQEISDIRDGTIGLPPNLEGPHVVLVFIASHTGQTVKRAAVGAEGFVLDHYDRTAVQAYLASVGDPLMQAFGSKPPRAIFCDSLEVYDSDWTGDLLEEFRRRRGYDLRPDLPALADRGSGKSAAVRHDWGETLTELFDERFVTPVQEWARQHGTLFRAQLYGIPPAVLSSYGAIDLPEGEGAQWNGFAPTRWASSASHLYGRPVTSSETWTWLDSPAFRASPLDLKAEADIHFLEGINQLVGHGWPYSPPMAGEPGWRFYAAAALNQHNPWWLVMPDIALYLQRVSFMLRQGDPVNDVAIYLPRDDAWAHFSPGKVSASEEMGELLGPDLIARVLEAGYGFDFIDDTVIDQLARIDSGTLTVGSNHYRVVILPGVLSMPVATLKKLAEFARQGGFLVATRRRPARSPGWLDQDARSLELRELSRKLFEGATPSAHFVRDENRELGKTLHGSCPPDVSLRPPAPDIGFVHRSTGWGEIYFLANTSNRARSTQASFRVAGMQPEWWDAFSGKVRRAEVLQRSPLTTTVSVSLEPYDSQILVFSHSTISKPATASAVDAPPPVDISAGWKVSFGKTGRSVFMEHLRSWTEDEATRFYSGQATYEKTLSVPGILTQPGLRVWLDFGDGIPVPPRQGLRPGMRAWLAAPVREAAVVEVNGGPVGSVWHPPYCVELTGRLHPGQNTLRIVVGNAAINAIAGEALPDYRLLESRYGQRFTPQDMQNLQPLPSGIVGTVRLVAHRAE
jgi:hypothetical protein